MKAIKITIFILLAGLCTSAIAYPVKIVNNSGLNDKHINIQIIAEGTGFWDFDAKKWDNTNGKTASSKTLNQIPDNTINLAEFGNHGGKVYVSIGGPTDTHMNGSQYYSPVPGTDGAPKNIVFDKIEIGGASNAIINQTAVDFVSLPLAFQVEGKEKVGYNCTRQKLMSDMNSSLTGNFSSLLVNIGSSVIGANNPTSLGNTTTAIDSFIEKSIPPNSNLNVVTAVNGIPEMFKMTTDANRNLKIDTENGQTMEIPFNCLTSFAVLCNAPQSNNPLPGDNTYNLFGAVSAYILRGVDFKSSDMKTFTNFKKFPYTADPYAKVIHNNCIDKKGYAFGYDDTGGLDFSSSEPREGKGFTIYINDCSDLKTILKLKD